tara:strand:- start:19 stop:840 length:822 start_codon:yes stop_codon:yes gene_type:complete
MKRKTKKKIGGDVCLNCSDWLPDGNNFCRKWTTRRGGHGEVENTICERDTGNCVKPTSDGARRQLVRDGQEEEEEENRQLVDDFSRELFEDEDEENESGSRTLLPWWRSRGGRKTFRRKKTRKKKKIGGYNSCLNFPNPDKYCQNIYKTLAHLKGKTQCDTKTGDCIEPGFRRRNSGDSDDSDNDVDWGDTFEIDDGSDDESDDESDHITSKPIKSARKKNSYSTSNYEGKLKSNLYIGGKKKSRKKTKKNKKKLKSRKKTRNSRKNRRKSRK